jgi:acyl carrier protein
MQQDGVEQIVSDLVAGLMSEKGISSVPHPDAILMDAGLSSLDTVKLVLALEDKLGIKFSDEMIDMSNFETINAIGKAIIAQMSRAGPEPADGSPYITT